MVVLAPRVHAHAGVEQGRPALCQGRRGQRLAQAGACLFQCPLDTWRHLQLHYWHARALLPTTARLPASKPPPDLAPPSRVPPKPSPSTPTRSSILQVRKSGHQSKLLQLYDTDGKPFGYLMLELAFKLNDAVRHIRVRAGCRRLPCWGAAAAEPAAVKGQRMLWEPAPRGAEPACAAGQRPGARPQRPAGCLIQSEARPHTHTHRARPYNAEWWRLPPLRPPPPAGPLGGERLRRGRQRRRWLRLQQRHQGARGARAASCALPPARPPLTLSRGGLPSAQARAAGSAALMPSLYWVVQLQRDAQQRCACWRRAAVPTAVRTAPPQPRPLAIAPQVVNGITVIECSWYTWEYVTHLPSIYTPIPPCHARCGTRTRVAKLYKLSLRGGALTYVAGTARRCTL